MGVTVIVPPAPLVDLATAKAHLNVLFDGDDTLIEAYIAAASAHIDGPGGWLDRAIGEQTLEFSTDWPAACVNDGRLILPYRPIIDVDDVTYEDADSADQIFADYRLTSLGELELLSGSTWPTTRTGSDPVRVSYVAGYETIPPQIVAAVLLMVGDLYANRETAVVGGVSSAIPMSPTVENLLRPFKVWSL